MNTHKHQCGLITVDDKGTTQLLDDFGCRHVWEHPDAPLVEERIPAEMVRRHRCPNCGLGPWYAEYKAPKGTRTLLTAIAALALQACVVTPTTCFMNYDHVSHPLLGVPFGPETEEGTIDSVGTTCRWEKGRMFFESGLSYKWPDSDLYGDDLLFNGRVAIKIWER